MKILLTNDDGYFAKGIKSVARELIKRGYDITIVAPMEENSGKSHSITLMKDIEIKKIEDYELDVECYGVAGTPADAVRCAVEFLKTDFDFCFSGCNLGYNAGMDILYSGTVSAAIEANIFGINSIAISAEYNHGNPEYDIASKIAVDVFEKIKDNLKIPQVLNINVPAGTNGELKVVKLAGSVMDKYTVEKRENSYFLRLSGRKDTEFVEMTDRQVLQQKSVSLTPLVYDFTNEKLIKNIEEMIWK